MPEVSFATLPRAEDVIARDWVFAEVARNGGGGEAVYVYHEGTGDEVSAWYAPQAGANLEPAVEAALLGGEPLVLHHNHPSNGSFIPLDLLSLVGLNPSHPDLPGLAAMWAHGNNGPRYRIAMSEVTHARAIVEADQLLTSEQSNLLQQSGGHEVFQAGWRHLVCLCLERKGYVSYDYDLSGFPNYAGRTYELSWAGRRLNMRDAFPIVAEQIVRTML